MRQGDHDTPAKDRYTSIGIKKFDVKLGTAEDKICA